MLTSATMPTPPTTADIRPIPAGPMSVTTTFAPSTANRCAYASPTSSGAQGRKQQVSGTHEEEEGRCAALDPVEPTIPPSAARYTLRQLATRIMALTGEIDDLNRRLATVPERHAPGLLTRVGVGPDTAAAMLVVAGDNPDRLASDAAFAALCGVSPIEASSRKTRRHRLNCGGDRHANPRLQLSAAFTELAHVIRSPVPGGHPACVASSGRSTALGRV